MNHLLSFLRFVAIFGALLLLINPKVEKQSYFIEKSKLVVLVDNSSSIADHSDIEVLRNKVSDVMSNTALEQRFDIDSYAFAGDLLQTDSLSFDRPTTNIARSLLKTNELHSNSKTAVVLFTDGNQTEGKDYEFADLNGNLEVIPVVVGDTTKYRDLAIGQVNLNRYAFLRNQFPIEVTVLYQGVEPASSDLSIRLNGNQVHRERLEFSTYEKSKTITTLLTATTVGIKSIVVTVEAVGGEKNLINNTKEKAIEIIDEQTNIALISDIAHPDIGALKKSIESNEQRSVNIFKPNIGTDLLENVDIFILYQPTANFRTITEFAKNGNIPTFTVTGANTDFQFLNQINESIFSIDMGYPEQEVFGTVNNSFPHFDISGASLGDYPPLLSNSGPVNFKIENDVLLRMNIKGVEMETPLMALVSNTSRKEIFLFGENIWKWRIQNFRDNSDFTMLDEFMGKLMVFLSKSGKRNRLEVEYEKVYEGSGQTNIRASFFDKTFILNPNANLTLRLEQTEKTSFSREVPMLFKGSYFEADLSDLPSGTFDFTVVETNERISTSGSFKILEFKPEQQFLSANYEKLMKLADKTSGNLYFLDDMDSVVADLAVNERYVPVQKSNRKVVSLIDFRLILGILVLALAIEWFIRKYNGLL